MMIFGQIAMEKSPGNFWDAFFHTFFFFKSKLEFFVVVVGIWGMEQNT